MVIGDVALTPAQDGHESGRKPAGRPVRVAAITMAASLAVLTAVLGFFDGTGLFAPLNWVDAGFLPTGATSPAWATVVFLPLLLAGSALLCQRIVRALEPQTPGRWVFWAAWTSVILAAFLAKLVYSLALLAVAGSPALHALPTVGAVLAECGLGTAKYAILGLVGAGATAVAYRIGTSGTPPIPGRTVTPVRMWSPIWFGLGAVVAAKATHATSAWAGGSAGAVILPVAGFGGAVLVSAMVWTRFGPRLAPGRSMLAVSATTCAASSLGFLLPWLVDGLVHGFGGGLYPVVGASTYLGAGALCGAVTSAGGSLWALGRARLPIDRLVPSARWGRFAISAGTVAIVLTVGSVSLSGVDSPSPVPTSPSSGSGGLFALTVRKDQRPIIVDGAGRQVLMRGVNVNQLIDYGQRDPAQPTVRPLSEADYAQMASDYGFNVQRLGLSWSALEPTRGVFDRAYLARVRNSVDQAARHGIYTVLDMHQDTYSKFVTAAAGTTCRIGAEPEFGNDGAPQWATLTDGAKGCGFMGRDLSPNVQQAFTNLYADTDGIGAEFARMWGILATEFAGDTAVAGYDLLNEPGPGNAPGVTSSILLGRLYQQAISAIRAAETDAVGGFHHLVFFEPSILWSGLGFDVSPPVGFAKDPGLVFSPHLYNESITMDQGLGVTLTTIERGYALAQRSASAYGVPLWSGEWGWFGDIAAVKDRYYRFLNLQNEDLLGSAIWVWKKACGDPQTGATDPTSGGLDLLACPAGDEMAGPDFLTPALAQAYPRAAPGRLTALTSSPTTVDIRLSGEGTGTLDVWIPGLSQPTISSTGLTGTAVSAQPNGGWRLTAQASGAYSLTAH